MNQLPDALLHELKTLPQFDEARFVAAHQQAAATSVRLNPSKDIGLFVTQAHVPWFACGRYLEDRPVFTLDPAYHAGAYYVQEASSMFTGYLLQQWLLGKKGLRVLDLCAAPGGKSTLIATLLDAESLLISNEVIRARATILDENITRWGYGNTWVTANDPRDFGRLNGYFDVVLVDAPCSGSGLFRKDARALADWSEANVQLCCERQQRILADIWPSLKQEGILIYATCSYSIKEDEAIMDWLGESYEVESFAPSVPSDWGVVTVTTASGLTGYRFFPDKLSGEGFFIAALVKKDGVSTSQPGRFKSGNDKKIKDMAGFLVRSPDLVYLPDGGGAYIAMQAAHEPDYQLLQKLVYFRKPGLRLGAPAGKDWIPAHDVALSLNAAALPGVDADRNQALCFLKREEMGLEGLQKGWQVVRYRGLGLGWIKSIGNRVNNYLPKHWRIRMEISEEERNTGWE